MCQMNLGFRLQPWAKRWILLTGEGQRSLVSAAAAINPISGVQSQATFAALPLFRPKALRSPAYSMIAPAMMQPKPTTINAAPKCKRPLEEGYGLLRAAV
jgi:hypothetical protein